MIVKGTWVTVESVILEAKDRAENLPEDTKRVPLVKWVKGTLTADADIGRSVVVVTVTGRQEQGILREVNPSFDVDYGSYVPELRHISEQVRRVLTTDAIRGDTL